MSDAALRRTVRRSVAFLSIPLWLLVMQMHNLQSDMMVHARLPSVLTLYLPAIVIAVLVGYLFLALGANAEPVGFDRIDE